MNLIKSYIDDIKKTQTIQDLFKEYQVELQEIDLIPVCFKEDLEVSARTQNGIIYLNKNLLKKPNSIKSYLSHEITHFLQQTTGDGPTEGSTDDTYLDNKYEQEGFQNQSKFISETEGDEEAKKYIDKVLDHHEMKGKERTEKRKKLLELAFYRNHNKVKKSYVISY